MIRRNAKGIAPIYGMSIVVALALFIINGCASVADEGAIPITTTSDDAREYFIEGRDLAERLRTVEAHEFFAKALQEDSLFALAHLGISGVQPSAREFFESLDKARALSDSVSKGEKLLIQSTYAAIEGDQSLQENNFKEIIELYPTDARAHNYLGQLYFGQQRYSEAIVSFTASIALDPEFSSPYNQLGYCYRFLGELDKAEETFKKYTDLIPDDPNPHDSYAELLLKKGEFDLAIESYRRALSLDPGFVASYIGIASNLCYQNLHSEARLELQQLYAVARNDGQRRTALFGIATTFVSEGLIDSALSAIIKARKIAEQINDVRAIAGDYNTIGRLLFEHKDFAGARAMHDSARAIISASDVDDATKSNTNRFYFFNVAQLASRLGNTQEADSMSAEFTTRVQSLSSISQKALAHQLEGILALDRKDYSRALSELSQANPRNPYNNYRKALAHQGLGDIDSAIAELKIVTEFNSVLGINYALVRGPAMALLASISS